MRASAMIPPRRAGQRRPASPSGEPVTPILARLVAMPPLRSYSPLQLTGPRKVKVCSSCLLALCSQLTLDRTKP